MSESPVQLVNDRLMLPFHTTQAATINLKGKILTAADAAFADPRQNKAFKDVIRWAFDDYYRTLLHDADPNQKWAVDAALQSDAQLQ